MKESWVYETGIPEANNIPLTVFLICSSSGLVWSKSSSVSSASSSLDDVSCCESLSLSSLDEPEDSLLSLPSPSPLLSLLSLLSSLLDDDSSSLPEVSGAGVMGTLFCISCCESLTSPLSSSSPSDELEVSSALMLLLSLSLLGDDSSSLPEAGVVGVEVPSCAGRRGGSSVELTFCANTELWLPILSWLIQIYVIFLR